MHDLLYLLRDILKDNSLYAAQAGQNDDLKAVERLTQIGDSDLATDKESLKELSGIIKRTLRSMGDPDMRIHLAGEVACTDRYLSSQIAKDPELYALSNQSFVSRTLVIYQTPDALCDIYKWAAGLDVQLDHVMLGSYPSYSVKRVISPKYAEYIIIVSNKCFMQIARDIGKTYLTESSAYLNSVSLMVTSGMYGLENALSPHIVLPRKVVLYGAFTKSEIRCVSANAYMEDRPTIDGTSSAPAKLIDAYKLQQHTKPIYDGAGDRVV